MQTQALCFVMDRYLPDFVSGDFDSVDPDLLNFYKEKVEYDTGVTAQSISKKTKNKKSIDPSVNQSINQSLNQSINQPTNQSVSQSVSQSVNQSINQKWKVLVSTLYPGSLILPPAPLLEPLCSLQGVVRWETLGTRLFWYNFELRQWSWVQCLLYFIIYPRKNIPSTIFLVADCVNFLVVTKIAFIMSYPHW